MHITSAKVWFLVVAFSIISLGCKKEYLVNPDIEYFLGDWENIGHLIGDQFPYVFAEWRFNHDGSGLHTFKTDVWRDSSYQFWYEFNPRTNAFVVNNQGEDDSTLPIVTWYLCEQVTQDSFVWYYGASSVDSVGGIVRDTLVFQMRRKK